MARMRCAACNTVWLESAAAHDAPSTRAAVVKRGTERDRRDLFAERECDEGSIKETRAPALGAIKGVGARNENSVLFRVDQLADTTLASSGAKPADHGASPTTIRTGAEDDGVIDLHALVTSRTKSALPVAPLFSEPPAVSLDVDKTVVDQGACHPSTKPASKVPLIAGVVAAAAFLVLLGFGVSFAFRGEEPVKHTATMVAPAPSSPAVAPTLEPTSEPVATAEDTKDAKESDASETKGKRGKARGKAKAAKSGPMTNRAPAAKPRPKAADPCHCKGDFNCILACTAKGGR